MTSDKRNLICKSLAANLADCLMLSLVLIHYIYHLPRFIRIAELVEEWGCYDSEFKLTCNDIDSKVALLEATFTPHCQSSNGNNKCLFYDEDR